MTFQFGTTSRQRLATVEPKLRAVVERALELTTEDFSVDCGVRTLRQQMQLYAKGRSIAELRAAGIPAGILARPGEPKVTWTLKSRHLPNANGLSNAVDLVPYPVDWNDLARFDAVAKAVFAAAKELKVRVRWGADWDQDGNRREKGEYDSPHFELA